MTLRNESSLHGSTACSLRLGQHLVGEVGTLSALSKAVLGSSELGQVEGSDFLGLLDLLLVGLDLSLELVNESLHAFVVLAILISLEGELLDLTLALPQVLLGISKTPALGIHFRL